MIKSGIRIPIVAVALAWLLAGPVAAQQSQRIAAVVNDDIVSVYDLESRIALVIASSNLPNRPDIQRRIAPQILRALIDERLKLQEARHMDITVSDADIQARIKDLERQNHLPPGGLAKNLASIGQDISAVATQIEAELAWASVVRARFRSRLHVTDREIDETLKRLEEAKDKPRYLVAEIFLPVDNPTDEAKVRSEADRLMQQIRSGADFSVLARNFSRGSTASAGGSLGWVHEGELGTELDKALAGMAPGQMTGPIRSIDGFRLLLLRDKQVGDPGLNPGNTQVTLSQVFLPLGTAASVQEVGVTMERARRMGARARTCEEMEGVGKESGTAMSGSLGTVKLKDLPDDIRATVTDLPINRASAPQRTKDGVVVLMVCKRVAPKPSELPDRSAIKNKLLNERLAIRAERYLSDLRRQAIVDIRL